MRMVRWPEPQRSVMNDLRAANGTSTTRTNVIITVRSVEGTGTSLGRYQELIYRNRCEAIVLEFDDTFRNRNFALHFFELMARLGAVHRLISGN